MNISFRCLESRIDTNNTLYGKFSITSIPSGQGNTFANALRRSLFSDLSGLAITHFCITSNPKLDYEFATLPGLTESLLDFSLNLKKIVLTGRLVDNFPESLSYYEKPVSKPSENICVIKNNNVLTKSFLKSFKILRSKSLNVKQKQTAGFSPAYPFSISYIPYVCPSLKEKDRKATPKQDVSPPEKKVAILSFSLSSTFPSPFPSPFPCRDGKGDRKGGFEHKGKGKFIRSKRSQYGVAALHLWCPLSHAVLPALPSDRKDRKHPSCPSFGQEEQEGRWTQRRWGKRLLSFGRQCCPVLPVRRKDRKDARNKYAPIISDKKKQLPVRRKGQVLAEFLLLLPHQNPVSKRYNII